MRGKLGIHIIWCVFVTAAFFFGLQRRAQPPSESKEVEAVPPSSSMVEKQNKPRKEPQAFPVPGSEGELSALAKIVLDGSPADRGRALARLLVDRLTAENAASILGQFVDIESGDRQRETEVLLKAWAGLDGLAAMSFVDQLWNPLDVEEIRVRFQETGRMAIGGKHGQIERRQESFRECVANAWARNDPVAAMAWLDEKSATRRPGYGELGAIVSGLVEIDVELAAEYLLKKEAQMMAYPDMTMTYDQVVVQAMFDKLGGWKAAAWAAELPSSSLRELALENAANFLATEDIGEAAEWAKNVAESEEGHVAVFMVSDRWASRDPDAAWRWLHTLPEGHAKMCGFDAVVNSLVSQEDWVAASKFLMGMERSVYREQAVDFFARRLAKLDPGAATAWAESIADFSRRESALEEIARVAKRQRRYGNLSGESGVLLPASRAGAIE